MYSNNNIAGDNGFFLNSFDEGPAIRLPTTASSDGDASELCDPSAS